MIKELINIEFSYNGNLGTLQQKTVDNKIFCGRLLQNHIITREEWKETMQLICNYFESEIKKVLEHPHSYTETF